MILLVEDEPGVALLEREALERAGFRVKDVGLGERALECVDSCERIALMVLDYRLPDMTGIAVLAALGERLDSLPVVAVTGYPDPAVEARMRTAGVYDYLIKDTDLKFLDELPKVVVAALECPTPLPDPLPGSAP